MNNNENIQQITAVEFCEMMEAASAVIVDYDFVTFPVVEDHVCTFGIPGSDEVLEFNEKDKFENIGGHGISLKVTQNGLEWFFNPLVQVGETLFPGSKAEYENENTIVILNDGETFSSTDGCAILSLNADDEEKIDAGNDPSDLDDVGTRHMINISDLLNLTRSVAKSVQYNQEDSLSYGILSDAYEDFLGYQEEARRILG